MDSERSTTSFRLCNGEGLDKAEWRDVECKPGLNNYQRFVKAIRTGTQAAPDFARGAEIQKLLDASFESDSKRAAVRV